MPLLPPLNDMACLRQFHDAARAHKETVDALAAQFDPIHELVALIRERDGRDHNTGMIPSSDTGETHATDTTAQ